MSSASNWSDEDLKELLKLFGQHLVAICGAYVRKDEDGIPLNEKFFSYSGFIIATGGHWFIVTAGHCLDKLKEAHEHKQIREEGTRKNGLKNKTDYLRVPASSRPTPLDFNRYI